MNLTFFPMALAVLREKYAGQLTMQWSTEGGARTAYAVLAVWTLVTGLTLAAAFVEPADAGGSKSYSIEDVRFESRNLKDGEAPGSVEVAGTLYVPDSRAAAIPAVVIVPSSGGVEKSRELFYADALAKAGIAALVVDSFQSRGVDNSIYDQSKLDTWDIEADAYAALRTLMADQRFLAERIAILGVSKGGTVARDTALAVRRAWLSVEDIAFAAHIAISPDCNWTMRSDKTTRAPILFLLAGLDDQTPAQFCVQQAERFRAAGNARVSLHVYKDAHHAWEELGSKPEFDPDVENYAQCKVWIEDDGRMFSDDDGSQIPEDDWHAWAAENCMTKGAYCCGGSRKQKQRATEDVLAFLRQNGF
jgi:dienelactone hydrolase